MDIRELYGYPEVVPKEGLTIVKSNCLPSFVIFRKKDYVEIVGETDKLTSDEQLLILAHRIKGEEYVA